MSEDLVKYHNNFIESIYKTDLIAKKLLIGISQKIQNIDKFGAEVEFDAKEICDLVGIGEDSRRHCLQDAVTRLMKTIITVKNPNDPDEWLKFVLLSAGEYKKGKLKVSVPVQMRPFLMELKRLFTTYTIQNIKPLKSKYSIRIYELLAQYRNCDSNKRKIDIQELRNLLGCKKKYPRFESFENRILEPAQKELKANCDIYFDYETKKTRNTITSVIFYIKHKHPKPQKPIPKPETPPASTSAPTPALSPTTDTYSPLAIELLRMFKDWHGNPDKFIEGIGDEDLIRDVMKRFPTTDKWGMVSEVAFFRGMVKDALIRKRADITRNIQGVRREYTQELFERREHYKKLNRDFKDDMIRFSEGRASGYEEQYLKGHYTYRQIDSLQIGEELIVLEDFLAWMDIY